MIAKRGTVGSGYLSQSTSAATVAFQSKFVVDSFAFASVAFSLSQASRSGHPTHIMISKATAAVTFPASNEAILYLRISSLRRCLLPC
mmetsp:Transcript_11831/g.23476  ORF Transcript_11831/g.23476 Transcript_11831/m.23476 type:complete len:88 (-) Transcript_11831:406-669(-)